MNGSQARVNSAAQQELDGQVAAVKQKIVVILRGFHWDLGWNAPFWRTSHELHTEMSNIVSKLEANRSLKFSLDGQAILALMWLEGVIFEEAQVRFARLQGLVENGQLEIGPAFVILDEFLAPEMALLQNLHYGRKTMLSFGAQLANFFDMSDSFGHVAQLAQVLKSYARYLLFSRGMTAEDTDLVMFELFSPDGSSIIAVPQQGGYQSGRDFGHSDMAVSANVMSGWLRSFEPRYAKAGLDVMLFNERKDYGGLHEFHDETVAAARQARPDITFIDGNNADYIALLDKCDQSHLPKRYGNLSGSGDRIVLRGVNAMRMELKLLNQKVYWSIISMNITIALAMLKREATEEYYNPRHEVDRLWSLFLKLQSHDAITGCHSDEVFDSMKYDYNLLYQESDWIKQKALAFLAGREKAEANHDNKPGRAPTDHFALLNLLPYIRSEVVIVPLPPKLQGHRRLRAYAHDGSEIEIQRIDEERAAYRVNTGSFGSSSIRLEQNFHAEEPSLPRHLGLIENEHLSAEVAANGTLKVTDKATGREYSDLLYFESIGDGGDTYTFVPVADRPYDSLGETAAVVHLCNGPLVSELEVTLTLHLPQRLDRRKRHSHDHRRIETVAVKVRTLVRLRQGSKQLEFETTVDNRAQDHRLRVMFPVGETVESSRAQTAFMVEEYPIRPPLDPNWKEHTREMEPPFNAITNHGLVIVGSLFSANRGITEYEAINTARGTVFGLTLMRCVELLSQEGDISTRRGQAGPSNVHVPKAQCQGEYTYSYTLGLVEDSSDIELAQAAQCWRVGFEPTFADIHTEGLLTMDCDKSVFACLMAAPDGRGVIAMSWAGSDPTEVKFQGKFEKLKRLDLTFNPSSSPGTQLGHHEIGAFGLR